MKKTKKQFTIINGPESNNTSGWFRYCGYYNAGWCMHYDMACNYTGRGILKEGDRCYYEIHDHAGMDDCHDREGEQCDDLLKAFQYPGDINSLINFLVDVHKNGATRVLFYPNSGSMIADNPLSSINHGGKTFVPINLREYKG